VIGIRAKRHGIHLIVAVIIIIIMMIIIIIIIIIIMGLSDEYRISV